MAELVFRCPACNHSHSVDSASLPAEGVRGPCRGCSMPMAVFPDGRVEGLQGAASAKSVANMRFACPVCGKDILLPLGKVPPAGLRGRCAGCKTRLLLHPDGTALEAAKAPKAGDMTRWHYRFGNEELGPFSCEEVRELVRNGAVKCDTALKPMGGDWDHAASFPALAPLFATASPEAQQEMMPDIPQDGPTGDEDHCFAHPETHPVKSCSLCMRYLCQACVVEKQAPGVVRPMKLCAACGGAAIALPHRVRWTAFHRDMPKVLTAPLRGDARYMLGILAFIELLKVPVAMAPFFGFFGMLILSSFQWAYLLHAMREVAAGSYDLPGWPEMSDFGEVFFRFIKVVLVTIVSLFPVIVGFCLLGAAATTSIAAAKTGGAAALLAGTGLLAMLVLFIAVVFYLFYLPMCIGIIAVFNTALPALNPLIIFKVMGRIGFPWALAALFWFSLVVFQVGATALFQNMSMVGVLPIALLSAYSSLLFSYSLGRVFAENEHKIGWT